MKKIRIILFTLIVCMIGMGSALANTVKSIDVTGVLDTEGTLHVTEVWKMNNTEKTEVYKEEYNLGNMSIKNFEVSDEDTVYSYNSSWDINGSFDDKKYQYGINYVNEGLELCWGISEYGNKTYTITYDVENAIFNTSDAQVLYMRLINALNNPAQSFTIEISGPNEYADTLDVWGYGSKSYAYVSNGKIYSSNEENTPLSSGDYLVLLVKFDQGTFTTDNSYDEYETFDSVYNSAEEGTFDYDYGQKTSVIGGILAFIMNLIPFAIFGAAFYFIAKGSQKYKFGTAGKGIKMSEINAFRDIPCKKDIYRAFFIAQAYGLNDKNTDFFGTVFLKWLNKDKISIIKTEKKKLIGTKEVTSIDFTKFGEVDVEAEKSLYDMIIDASENDILDEDEFQKYAKDNYSYVLKWFDRAEEYGRSLYIEDSLVTKDKGKYVIDDKVKEDAIELAGLKKYLKEFAHMDTKEPMEVKLWKEYLMYAQIFGIADEVAKQFKKLYPEVLTDMNNSNIDVTDIILLNQFSHAAVVSATSARSAAQSYSSGGGGFSSGGGGGGSFGGGGGGTR